MRIIMRIQWKNYFSSYQDILHINKIINMSLSDHMIVLNDHWSSYQQACQYILIWSHDCINENFIDECWKRLSQTAYKIIQSLLSYINLC